MNPDKSTANPTAVEIRVSSYDLLNSFLVSSITLIGTLVLFLFFVWLSMIIDFSDRASVAVEMLDEGLMGNEKPIGFADDIFEPGVEMFPEVETPQLKDALEAVTEAVSSVRADLALRDGDAAEMGKGQGFGSRDGGPGGGGDIIPEHLRWKMEYNSPDVSDYGRQLSFFGIDLGVISQNTNEIIRIKDVGGSPSVHSSDRATEKKAFYFAHEKPRFRRWDETLAKRNNIPLENKLIVQFYPEATRRILRTVEQAYLEKNAPNMKLRNVRKTFFVLEPSAAGFEFRITNMTFRQ
jgi:hypothetical protein